MAKGKGKSTTDVQILEELRKGFASINERLDKVIENTGAHLRDLENRVQALEEKVTQAELGAPRSSIGRR